MTEFRAVASLDELPDMGGKEVAVEGRRICLFKHQGQVFALDAECPHRGAPLAAGWLENGHLFCALHGWEFDLRTGECRTRCSSRVTHYPARVVGGIVEVAFAAPPPEQTVAG